MPDEAPVTSATGFLSFIGLPSRRWSVIIVHSPYDEHHIVRQKKNTGYDRCGSPWGTSARPGAWRWGSGLRAPTREGTPKRATGTCACPSQLRASELRLRGALACKAPSAPTPSATHRVVQRFPKEWADESLRPGAALVGPRLSVGTEPWAGVFEGDPLRAERPSA